MWDQAITCPSLGRLLGASSAWPHHIGGSGAATCPEKVMYSKTSTVSLDPMGKCRTPGYTVRTSKFGPGPPRVRTGPLEWDPDPPPVWGPGRHSRVPRFQDRTHPGLNQGPGGGPVPTRDGNRVGITRIYGSRIHTHKIKPNPYPYPFTLVGTDLYPYPYPSGIRYPTDIRYPPAH
jgi:hypothetical protein